MRTISRTYIAIFIVAPFLLLSALVWVMNSRQVPLLHSISAANHVPDKTITLFVPANPQASLPADGEDFVLQAIEEKFGVQVELLSAPSGAAYAAELEAKLLANDPPDMWIEQSEDLGATLALYGVLADLGPYVSPASMPNYFKYWVTENELKQYRIHNRFSRAPLPYDKNSYRSYYIRQDWLDALGLKLPSNYEEYIEVLHAFTYDDPDGNKLQDTYGFSVSGNSNSLTTDWPEYGLHGLVYPAYMSKDKLIDMESDLRMQAVVEDILKVVDAGVVDRDWFLNAGSAHVEKAIKGKIGIVFGQTAEFALDANPGSLQSLSRAYNPEANWVPFNPLGREPLGTIPSPGAPFVFSKKVVDKAPVKAKQIIAILDWLGSEEGFLLTHYGLEGKHYTRSGNTITLLNNSGPTVDSGDLDWLSIWRFFTPETPMALGLQIIDPRLTERDKQIREFLAQMPARPKLGVTLSPPIGIDVGAFRTRQNELLKKLLFYDKSGARWPEYHADLMNNYYGNEIIANFEQQVREAAQ
ncbi:extracellular solute-binding protein [Paenibacillus agaridevorans]|uniref:extracellular solute-binding protein n=1 Tax=Paenibacillus agaridevorans TaxID=171404 RepID=UPI0015E82778|nr:extracellular solute-binding protein [Paenibacillus agaridevorans]